MFKVTIKKGEEIISIITLDKDGLTSLFNLCSIGTTIISERLL